MTDYGYVGLGSMGSAMAERLLSTGAKVTVFDIDPATVERAAELGATPAGSAAEVAAASAVMSTCVPAAIHLEAVLHGRDGVRDGAHDGLVLLIHSTVHPETVTAARNAASSWGVSVFDACVAGGADAARRGELALFAGGYHLLPPPARRLLDIYATKVIAGGAVGAGAALKIGVNVMTYMQQAAARIAFPLVEQNGADTDALVDAWRHIGQLGQLTEQYLALLSIPEENIRGSFRRALERNAAIAEKDLELAQSLGDVGPELAAVLASMAAAMATVMGVPGPHPESPDPA